MSPRTAVTEIPEPRPAPADRLSAGERRLVALAQSPGVNPRAADAFGAFVMRDANHKAVEISDFHLTLTNFIYYCWYPALRPDPAEKALGVLRCGILAPWRHGKTLWALNRTVLYEIGKNTNIRIRIVSGSDDEAMRRVLTCRQFIDSKEYQLVFPHVRPAPIGTGEYTKHSIYVERSAVGPDPTLKAAGVFSAEAGGGNDIMMFDDVATFQNMIEKPAERPRVLEAMQNVWLQRIDPGVRILYIGTTWHYDDPPHALMRQERTPWRWLVIGVNDKADALSCSVDVPELDYSIEAPTTRTVPTEFRPRKAFALRLWNRRDTAFLKGQSSDATAYNRGYRQLAPREEDRKFSNLTPMLRRNVTLSDLLGDDLGACTYFGGFDPAGGKRPGNALVTAALVPYTYTRVIVNIRLFRGALNQKAMELKAAHERFKHEVILVENNGVQDSILDGVEVICPELRGVLVPFTTTGSKKADPESGVDGLENDILRGVWALALDDPYDTGVPLKDHEPMCGCPYHVFIEDLSNYAAPNRTYDSLMAWWFCRTAVKRWLDGSLLMQEAEADPLDDLGRIPADEVEVGSSFI